MIYFVFKGISPLIAGILWLVLSVAVLELLNLFARLKNSEVLKKYNLDIYLLHVSYGLITAFIIRHILVHMQTEKFIGNFKVRLLIELFAIIVFIYFFMNQDFDRIKNRLFKNIQPLFLELAILFFVFTIAVELKQMYHPIVWMAASLIFMGLGTRFKDKISRLKIYSLFFFWLTSIHIPFTTSRYVTSSISSFELDWLMAVIAIFIQFIYLFTVHKGKGFQDIELPAPVEFFRPLLNLINKKLNLWVYYPLFISIALFLIWSFDKSILTFLLSLEAFSIFILSVILKENHFRFLSQAAILACLGRLIFYDLANANTLTKALVCIGVSLLMFGMNIIYNKFKERFTTK
jgi:hypothetical protein